MRVFKYCPDDEHSIENLKQSKLWFSNPESFKDQYDMNLPFLDLDFEAFKKSSFQFADDNPELFKKFVAIFEETKVPKSAEEFSVSEMMSIMKKTFLGITCFTDTDNSKYMWRNYGGNETGFCLCFESDNDPIFFKDLTKVEYCEGELPKIDLMSNDLDTEMEIFSTTKRSEFKPEREYRLFKHSSGLHKYDKKCLIGVTFGKLCRKKREIIDILQNYYGPGIDFVLV